MTRTLIATLTSCALLGSAVAPTLALAHGRSTYKYYHPAYVINDRTYDPYWQKRYDGSWGHRYSDYRRPHIVYYDRRPDVVYVYGRPHRYHYDQQRRHYYYRDNNGSTVVLGAALGAIGLAAILSATH
jgi:hypothetical protein